MDRIVDYYFAPQSPFTYLGHPAFAEALESNQATARVKPIDLGRVFSVSGGLPLGQRPKQRQSYRLLELARHSKLLGLPLNPHPKFFPVSGDAASRHIIAAIALAGDEAAMTLAFAFQRAVWAEERDIADAATIAAIVADCGLDQAAVGDAANAPATQSRYEANTQEAIDAEVFGAPTYIPRFGAAKGERFWGQDRIEFLANALRA